MKPHERTIEEYLNLEKKQFDAENYIFRHPEWIQSLEQGIVPNLKTEVSWAPVMKENSSEQEKNRRRTAPRGIEFRSIDAFGVAVNIIDKVPVGFLWGTTPVCISAERGRGIGSHLLAHFAPVACSETYSREGRSCRIAAHALLVTWACLDGDTVPSNVLDEYCVFKRRLRLRKSISYQEGHVLSAERIVDVYR